jgi:hypothetical protein
MISVGRSIHLALGALLFGLVLAVGSGSGGAGSSFGTARAAEGDLNACGCRESTPGFCVCEKKSKCGCPGECEPKGCEERRAKQMEKEIEAETKKAQEGARRQNQSQGSDDGSTEAETPKAAAARNRKSAAASKANTPRMTATQKRDLARLLGLYLSEHPADGGIAVEQVRAQVKADAETK